MSRLKVLSDEQQVEAIGSLFLKARDGKVFLPEDKDLAKAVIRSGFHPVVLIDNMGKVLKIAEASGELSFLFSRMDSFGVEGRSVINPIYSQKLISAFIANIKGPLTKKALFTHPSFKEFIRFIATGNNLPSFRSVTDRANYLKENTSIAKSYNQWLAVTPEQWNANDAKLARDAVLKASEKESQGTSGVRVGRVSSVVLQQTIEEVDPHLEKLHHTGKVQEIASNFELPDIGERDTKVLSAQMLSNLVSGNLILATAIYKKLKVLSESHPFEHLAASKLNILQKTIRELGNQSDPQNVPVKIKWILDKSDENMVNNFFQIPDKCVGIINYINHRFLDIDGKEMLQVICDAITKYPALAEQLKLFQAALEKRVQKTLSDSPVNPSNSKRFSRGMLGQMSSRFSFGSDRKSSSPNTTDVSGDRKGSKDSKDSGDSKEKSFLNVTPSQRRSKTLTGGKSLGFEEALKYQRRSTGNVLGIGDIEKKPSLDL